MGSSYMHRNVIFFNCFHSEILSFYGYFSMESKSLWKLKCITWFVECEYWYLPLASALFQSNSDSEPNSVFIQKTYYFDVRALCGKCRLIYFLRALRHLRGVF